MLTLLKKTIRNLFYNPVLALIIFLPVFSIIGGIFMLIISHNLGIDEVQSNWYKTGKVVF